MKKDAKRRKLEMALFFRRAKREIQARKGVFAVYLLLRLSVILCFAIYQTTIVLHQTVYQIMVYLIY